jgi:hypothetical protein
MAEKGCKTNFLLRSQRQGVIEHGVAVETVFPELIESMAGVNAA